MDILIGFCIGVYVMGVVIALGFRVMGSERSVPSAFIWPITWIIDGWNRNEN